MTDIDAIRKTPRQHVVLDPLHSFHSEVVPASALEAALAAYDAKCEELRGMALLKERMWQSESECVELRHHVARLGAKVSALDASLGTVIAERDAAHREKAAAMGLVEGHALTIAKLEAERDAAVREREGLLAALKAIRDLRCSSFRTYEQDSKDMRRIAGDAIDAQLAALAPPTEQPCSRCHGKTTIKTINLRRPFAGAMTEPCPDCQPSDREVMP